MAEEDIITLGLQKIKYKNIKIRRGQINKEKKGTVPRGDISSRFLHEVFHSHHFVAIYFDPEIQSGFTLLGPLRKEKRKSQNCCLCLDLYFMSLWYPVWIYRYVVQRNDLDQKQTGSSHCEWLRLMVYYNRFQEK